MRAEETQAMGPRYQYIGREKALWQREHCFHGDTGCDRQSPLLVVVLHQLSNPLEAGLDLFGGVVELVRVVNHARRQEDD